MRIVIKKNDLANKSAAVRAAAAQEIARAAMALEAREKEYITELDAVDTGFMRSSVQALPDSDDGLRWIVGNAADYSPVINYGGHNRPARPFIEPAVEDVRPQFIGNLKRALAD